MKRMATCLAWLTIVSVLSARPGAGAATQTRPGSDRNASGLNVRNFGAKGDGKTDDTAAFLRALDACQQTECASVYVPSGRYLIKTHLVIPEAVALVGNWQGPATFTDVALVGSGIVQPAPEQKIKAAKIEGSVLLAVEGAGKPDGPPFLTMKKNSVIKGLTIFYPEQTYTNPPVAYPWTVATAEGGATNVSIIDVLMVNPYQAVDFGSYPSPRHFIRNLNAQALYRGIYVDQCIEIGRMENVHLNEFWDDTLDSPLNKFTHEHGQGFIFGRTDWELMVDCFAINYNVDFRFTSNAPSDVSRTGPNPIIKDVPVGNVLITGGGGDWSNVAVLVEGSQAHAGLMFVNCNIFGDVIVKPTNEGMVKFTNCGFYGSMHGQNGVGSAKIDAGRSRISFSNCHFENLVKQEGMPLIDVLSGRVSWMNCVFLNSTKTYPGRGLNILPEPGKGWNPEHIVLEPGVISAVIVGNEFYAPARIVNRSNGKVVISDNVDQTDDVVPER